ncbi:cupin domain-containing protein [Patulibacter defluvii]|uniref:cupin domain-containing protein n=1 Tax=Patulibacter defluvii TaxID=3095358 RepID=UPI002A75C7DA|nr:cupin domain-containing protein [Patulibacter sp. DM4]
MVAEARIVRTEAGLVPAGPGWFVLNASEARWVDRPGRGRRLPFTGWSDEELARFPQLGVNLHVLEPGEPIGMYHWEADAEGFLVLAGEALLLIEGEERPLRAWDYVHCPPGAAHMVVGAGAGRSVVLALGAREHQEGADWGAYPVAPAALRHGAGVETATADPEQAYARFADPQPTGYRDGWLPGGW